MDGSRFDTMVRSLATVRTRRGTVASAAGAFIALAANRRGVIAQTCLPQDSACGGSGDRCCDGTFCVNGWCSRFVSPGEACYSDDECSPSQSSNYFCRDNGMAISPACCGFEEAGCGTDAHCCGDLVCLNGTCGLAPVAIYGGVACWSDEQCGWPLLCDDNGTYLDGPLHCCLPPGGWCLKHADCCGDSFCLDGSCG